ncbi:MAG: EamA family transporter [Pigmentiphaga sp.]|nr:EamA family transporter [Pigmentiphaga sp.]
MNPTLTTRHVLLALLVVAIWGTNFVVIKVALAQLPPLLFATLRFALAAVPLVLLVRRPAVSWRNLALYGLTIGAGQFGLLFFAMTRYISPGLASLIIQSQVFFTVGLALAISGERLRGFQIAAGLIALAGVAIIAGNTDGQTTVAGLLLTLTAAFCWALGNLTSRAAGRVDMLAYIAWSSLFAVPPLAVLSVAFEGWPAIAASLRQTDALGWAAVAWQSVGNTIFGYGVWAWLLSRYPAATVAPFALLVPIFGMGAATLLLDEPLQSWKLLAAGLVVGGLSLNLLWPRYIGWR